MFYHHKRNKCSKRSCWKCINSTSHKKSFFICYIYLVLLLLDKALDHYFVLTGLLSMKILMNKVLMLQERNFLFDITSWFFLQKKSLKTLNGSLLSVHSAHLFISLNIFSFLLIALRSTINRIKDLLYCCVCIF